MVERDILDETAKSIEVACGIPFTNIIITSTHTHHAPSTVKVHGYERDKKFVAQLKEAIVSAVVQADGKFTANADADLSCEFYFWVGQEAVTPHSIVVMLPPKATAVFVPLGDAPVAQAPPNLLSVS